MSSLMDKFSTQRILNNSWNSYPQPRIRYENISRAVTGITFKNTPGYLKLGVKEVSSRNFIDLTSYSSMRGIKDCEVIVNFNCSLDDFIDNKYSFDDITVEADLLSNDTEFSKYIQLLRVLTSYIGTESAYECRRNINN